MNAFLEYLKHLAKSKTAQKHSSSEDMLAEIPQRLGRIQNTPNHSLEILYLLTQSQSTEVKEPILPPVTESNQTRASPYQLLKKNISFRSPGVIRVIKNKEDFERRKTIESTELKQKRKKHDVIDRITRKKSFSHLNKNENSTMIMSPQHYIKERNIKLTRSPTSISSTSSLSIYAFNSMSCKDNTQKYMEKSREIFRQKSESVLNLCSSNENIEKKTHFTNGDWFHGQIINKNKSGYGIYYYSKYDMKFKGKWTSNQIEGRGNISFTNGDSLECTIYNNKLEPGVILTYSSSNLFHGNLKDGLLSGTGTMKYGKTGLYSGLFAKSGRHGHGVLQIDDSIFYEGYFENDTTNGPGVLVIHSHKEQCVKFSKKQEFGNTRLFPEFSSLPLDTGDIIFISVTSKFFQKRTSSQKNFPGGKFQAGRLEGLGYARYGTHGYYIGNFSKGRRHGWGRMVYLEKNEKPMKETEGVYEGMWKDNLRHGIGNMKWTDGSVYEGNYRNNYRHNVTGKFIFKDGKVYEGGWIHDKMNGSGILIMTDGTVFKGNFLQGYPVNFGVIESPDMVYKGSLTNLVPHGYGVIKYKNGNKFKGNFANGKIKGKGTMKYANGDFYEGDWENDLRHGYGGMKFADGKVYTGQWILNIPQMGNTINL